MTRRLQLFISLLLILSFAVLAQKDYNGKGEGVALKFITDNGYSNNLYIDNVIVGKQYDVDVTVLGINNLPNGLSYTIGSSPFVIQPEVVVANVGITDVVAPFDVTINIPDKAYSSTKTVSSLQSGQTTVLVFDDFTVTPGNTYNVDVTTSLGGDQNPLNNTFSQVSNVQIGAERNILLEQWTSSTCGPCASNNPTIDNFVETNFGKIVPVKYHVGWPSPGNDPMYLHNPTQSYDRRYYYGVNSVPNVIMDGIVNPSYPYSSGGSLPNAWNSRINDAAPVSVEVVDTPLEFDSLKTTITVDVLSPLAAGNYFLRVMAVERKIDYATAPGTNGEKVFYDVFRKSYPNSEGTPIPTDVGSYTFEFSYEIDKVTWVDSMIYTIAFVQNDDTKEVLNSGKGRDHLGESMPQEDPGFFTESKPVSIMSDFVYADPVIFNNPMDAVMAGFNFEFFEGSFPGEGWSLYNPDGGISFDHFDGANGPSFAGSKSVTVEFFSYSTVGQKDTLVSKVYYGLTAQDSVKFDYAHAEYPNFGPDGLAVLLSVDGGDTFPYTIFDKSGDDLATVPATTSSFVPVNASQWAKFAFPLEGLVIPVELVSFTAEAGDTEVVLNWNTATETNNLGFEIEKMIDGKFSVIGFVEGNGSTSEPQQYQFTDRNLISGNYTYRLKQIDFNGQFSYSPTVETDIIGAVDFSLEQNYPNPFNPATVINYSIPEQSLVKIKLFDVTGSEVAQLVNELQEKGNYKIDFDASHLSSGVYFYQMTAGSANFVKKMNLIK